MNLQFLSGNPIAKRSKKRKAKSVVKKASKKGPRMGSKKKYSKNPTTYTATRGGKTALLGKAMTIKEGQALRAAATKLAAKPRVGSLQERLAIHKANKRILAAKKKAGAMLKAEGKHTVSLVKKLKAARKAKAKITDKVDDQVDKILTSAGLDDEMKTSIKGKTMAKKKAKKKASKKASKKSHKKAAKKSGKKKASKKVAKKSGKKHKAAKKYAAKKKTSSKSKHSSKKKASKKVSFKRKTYKFKKRRVSKVKIAKNRHSLSVYLKNPLKGVGQAMGKASQIFGQGTGIDLKEAGMLVGAGATIGTLESLVSKYGQKVIVMMPVQLQSSAPALIVGLLGSVGHALASKKLGKNHVAVEAMKALVAASIVRVASATLSATINKAIGMSGVDFTPMRGVPSLSHINGVPRLSTLRGVDYTPMSGVDYTPMSGMGNNPNPGSMGFKSADFGSFDTSDFGGGGGYTEGRKTSKADFGGMDIDDEMALESDSDEASMG